MADALNDYNEKWGFVWSSAQHGLVVPNWWLNPDILPPSEGEHSSFSADWYRAMASAFATGLANAQAIGRNRWYPSHPKQLEFRTYKMLDLKVTDPNTHAPLEIVRIQLAEPTEPSRTPTGLVSTLQADGSYAYREQDMMAYMVNLWTAYATWFDYWAAKGGVFPTAANGLWTTQTVLPVFAGE